MKPLRAVILLSFLILFAFEIHADLDTLVSECESCHGPQGASGNNDIPIIGGQSADYILTSLRNYQVWSRPCIKSARRYGDTTLPITDMCKVTGDLEPADLEALAGHFSSLPFVPAVQEFDTVKAAEGNQLHAAQCEYCHTEGGRVPGRGPRLAGQWMNYLKVGMKYIPTGEHLVPPSMEKKIVQLTEHELDALMNYYASQQGR
jgi:sulfide dehydrogenase cytochrome subunit